VAPPLAVAPRATEVEPGPHVLLFILRMSPRVPCRAAMRQAPLVLVLVLCAAAPARADPPAATAVPEHVAFRLSFTGIDGCPDEAALRVQVSGWVGYDPFVPKAPALIKLWLERKGKKFVAHFTQIDAEGESAPVTKEDPDCASLFRTLGIRIGLTIADSAAPCPRSSPLPRRSPYPSRRSGQSHEALDMAKLPAFLARPGAS
jgi:hypothetical protein